MGYEDRGSWDWEQVPQPAEPRVLIGVDVGGSDHSAYCTALRQPDGRIVIIDSGIILRRIVRSARRAGKLRKRGEDLKWDAYLAAWTWDMRLSE